MKKITITDKKGIVKIANDHRQANKDSNDWIIFGEYKRIDIAIRYLKSLGLTVTEINKNKFEIK